VVSTAEFDAVCETLRTLQDDEAALDKYVQERKEATAATGSVSTPSSAPPYLRSILHSMLLSAKNGIEIPAVIAMGNFEI
jgi:hypothetical protein